MKLTQSCMSLLTSFLLLIATSGLEACGVKDQAAAPVVQQQSANPPVQDAGTQQAPAAAGGQAAQADQGQPPAQLPEVNLTADGLDELLAPVALYPDPVLAVMLQAAVDPQEVMDGGNWLVLDQNQNLKEAALDQASSKAGFTPVMQALLHYPTVIDLMCQQFDWTKQLGAAYQGNPKAVLESVQRLRAQAVDNGALKSSPQMSVQVKQDQGREVVELKPTDPKVVYVPQYDPTRVYSTTTTTTTNAPASYSGNSTTVVQQQSSGVSTESAVLIGLLSFGAGIAVGKAINSNNYYYPAWGYGGVWYGPRPYYPPPYHPIYYPGYRGGYYNRPVHYGNTNIYINNNNYYNRFNNNNNLNPNYKPRPVPYNNNPNGAYAKSMGNTPGGSKGVNYRPNPATSTGNGQGNYQGNRPANNPSPTQRPSAGDSSNNWKGQSTYQGNKGPNTAGNPQSRPSTLPSNANGGANNRASIGNAPTRNASSDRGYGQPGTTRPSTTNTPAARPSTGSAPTSRPTTSAQRPSQPTAGQGNRTPPSSGGGAFGGVSSPNTDKAASNRGKASMGANSKPTGNANRKR